jgi:hypothetical protein
MDASMPLGVTISRGGKLVPPSGSLASFWQNATNQADVLFAVALASGSIIEVDISWTQPNRLSPHSNPVTAVTQGAFFYPYLDSDQTSSAKIAPTSLPTGL